MIAEKCPAIGEIVMVPTSALSSMYAYDGGVVIAYLEKNEKGRMPGWDPPFLLR